MKFGGLQKTSLIDFPDKISSTLFTVGCNLRCPYCHNGRLVVDPKPPFLSEEDALKVLESRRKYINAVCITGGEPTMSRDLPDFIERLNCNGFSVKLDTNGFYPNVLAECLPKLDYVAMDFKTSLEKYKLLGAHGTKNLIKSLELLKKGTVEYELRNTTAPSIVTEEDIPKMGMTVNGAKRFVFQQFVPGETIDKRFNKVKPYSTTVIRGFAEIMKDYTEEVILRI